MDLSLETLLLALHVQNAHIAAGNTYSIRQPRLSAAALWSKDQALRSDLCYVIPAKLLKSGQSFPPGTALVIVGAVEEEPLRSGGVDALVLDVPVKKDTFNAVFNQINGIFQRYQQWALSLSQILARNASLDRVLEAGEAFFGNPVLVLDRNFCLLSKFDPNIKMGWVRQEKTNQWMLSEEAISLIKAFSSHPGRESRSPYLLSEDYLPYSTLFLHVSRGNAIFTLAVPQLRTPLETLSPSALRYFAECVYTALCQTDFHYGHSRRFEEFLKKLLSGEQIEQAVIDQQLLTLGWFNSDRYLCLAFEINGWDRANSVYHSTCMSLESAFAQSFAFLYEDKIVALLNLDQARISRDGAIQKLILFLREHLLHVGISYTFFDFSTLSSYYRQSLAALEMGGLYAPDIWHYRFEDYVLPYFMHYGTTRINGRHLCHPDLVQLWMYDDENGTELLPTLQEYLISGLNATATARQLFIHRNTLYQRLEKIQQIITSDLNDPDTRLFMLMSYRFIDLLKLDPVKKASADPSQCEK